MLIGLVFLDGFEALLLSRRVTRKFRFTRLYYVVTWRIWSAMGRSIRKAKRRETFLSAYGPLSIVVLFGHWAIGLIVGFAALHQSLETPLNTPGGVRDPFDYLYMSGVTLFTLGFGDVTPSEPLGRMIAVIEAGIGFGFLAAVIGYLPVLYGAFSRRELPISLLDARAGSPPTAAEILVRIAPTRQFVALGRYLEEWERWSGEVLESHLSFPVLTYYRSQHDNQSWLAALTAILDTCAVVMSRLRDIDPFQAQLTSRRFTDRHPVPWNHPGSALTLIANSARRCARRASMSAKTSRPPRSLRSYGRCTSRSSTPWRDTLSWKSHRSNPWEPS